VLEAHCLGAKVFRRLIRTPNLLSNYLEDALGRMGMVRATAINPA
jgi:hypothetical protein